MPSEMNQGAWQVHNMGAWQNKSGAEAPVTVHLLYTPHAGL